MNKFQKQIASKTKEHKKKCDSARRFYKSKYGIITKELSFREARKVIRRIAKGTNFLKSALLQKYN